MSIEFLPISAQNRPYDTISTTATCHLRWSDQGKLQQQFLIKRVTGVCTDHSYEWRDIPTEGSE